MKHTFVIPKREGDRPLAASIAPHLQLTEHSPPDIQSHMANWALGAIPATTSELREEPTRVSVATTRALWLDESVDAQPNSFMPPNGNREFAHLHADGSWHLHLEEELVQEVLDKGWGERHPWHRDKGILEILIYAPRNLDEVKTVKSIVLESIRYVSKGAVKPFSI